MTTILKENNVVHVEKQQIIITNMLSDREIAVRVKEEINPQKMEQLFYKGTEAEVKAGVEEKVVYLLKKKYPDYFYDRKDSYNHNTVLKLRAIIQSLRKNHAFSDADLKRYREKFYQQTIFLSRTMPEIVKEKLIQMGFPTIRRISETNQPDIQKGDILITDMNLTDVSTSFLGKAVIVFSNGQLSVGPVWTIENIHEINYYQKSSEEQRDADIPEFSKEIIYSFLGNTLMYLIDDCYQRLTVDTGIPFRKILKLHYPTMRVDAYLQ